MNQVSVIIPAHNEEKTLKQVIDIIKQSNIESEIIVVDNCSDDNTATVALKEGARVELCQNKGKGYAMEAGVNAANGDILVFLDADVQNYNDNIINLLASPILEGRADFVKSTFDRTKGGIVTEIAVKPLLEILFPNMYKFSEPISGMIACKKSILEKLVFEKDYGVDIGILIDVIKMNCVVEEVNIGSIENMSHLNKTTERMKNMSKEIIQAIIKRAN